MSGYYFIYQKPTITSQNTQNQNIIPQTNSTTPNPDNQKMSKGLETFQYKNTTLTCEGLQVFYTKDSVKKVLIDYVRGNFYDPNSSIFYKTTRPDAVMILDSFGDAGEYYVKEYYVDLNTLKFVSLKYSDSQIILIKDMNGNEYKINFGRTNDGCVKDLDTGADLVGLMLNNKYVYNFNSSVHQGCDDIVTYGPPFESLKTIGLSSDFNKVFFYYDLSSTDRSHIDEENFSLDLSLNKVQKENPNNLLVESQF